MKTGIGVAAVLIGVLVGVLWYQSLKPAPESEIVVLCGGSMRAVLEPIIEDYKKVSTDTVVTTYGGSGELCAQIKMAGRGDVYICHDPFMKWAADQDLISEWDSVGYLDICIAVVKGNPHEIKEVKDLAKPGLRLGIGDQRYSTSGVMTKEMLRELKYREEIMANVRLETHGHQARCTDVAMGTLDATIVWSAVAHLFRDKLDIIPIPASMVDSVSSATFGKTDLRNIKVTIGVVSRTKSKPGVQAFYEFLKANKGRFPDNGFRAEAR